VRTPDFQALASAMQSLVPTRLAELVVYRSIKPDVARHHGSTFLDGTHSGKAGGRYNPPNGEPITYFAGSQTLAVWESEQEQFMIGLHLSNPPQSPRLVCSVILRHLRVLDLDNGMHRHHLNLQGLQQELVRPSAQWRHALQRGDPVLTHDIGRAAWGRADLDGILFPSWLSDILGNHTLPRLQNLVLFMDPARGDRPRNHAVSVTVHDPSGLAP